MANINIPDEELKTLKAFLKMINEAGTEYRELLDFQHERVEDFQYANGRLSALTEAFEMIYGERYHLVSGFFEEDLIAQFHILIRADKLFEDQEERT